jgi:hypothetical protein
VCFVQDVRGIDPIYIAIDIFCTQLCVRVYVTFPKPREKKKTKMGNGSREVPSAPSHALSQYYLKSPQVSLSQSGIWRSLHVCVITCYDLINNR